MALLTEGAIVSLMAYKHGPPDGGSIVPLIAYKSISLLAAD
jgi:hypothetical protein